MIHPWNEGDRGSPTVFPTRQGPSDKARDAWCHRYPRDGLRKELVCSAVGKATFLK